MARRAGLATLEERCFIAGRANPLASPVTYAVSGDQLAGTVTLPSPYQSRPGFAHGGVVAASIDDLVERQIDLAASIDRIDGPKVYVSGNICSEGQVCAESDGLFIAPRPAARV